MSQRTGLHAQHAGRSGDAQQSNQQLHAGLPSMTERDVNLSRPAAIRQACEVVAHSEFVPIGNVFSMDQW